jgi:hypothetical protein
MIEKKKPVTDSIINMYGEQPCFLLDLNMSFTCSLYDRVSHSHSSDTSCFGMSSYPKKSE